MWVKHAQRVQGLVDLTLAVVAINGWNRFAIGFRSVPGSYRRKG